MENTHEFSNDPTCCREYRRTVHEVRVDVASNMPDVSIVSDLIECRQQPRNQDLEAAGHVGVVFQLTARSDEVSRFARRGGEGSAGVTIQDCVNNFAKSPSGEFGRCPAPLHEIVNNVGKLFKKRSPETAWNCSQRGGVADHGLQ